MNAYDTVPLDDATPAERRLLEEVESLAADIDADASVPAIEDAVRRMCEHRNWQYGEVWLASAGNGDLRRTAVWDSAHSGKTLRAMPTSPDEFVTLALWKRAVCSFELEHATTARARAAFRLGFQRVVAVPLVVGAATLGVMVFLLADGESLENGLGAQVVAVALELDHTGRGRTRTAQAMFGWHRGEALRLDVGRIDTPRSVVESELDSPAHPTDAWYSDSIALRKMFDGAIDALLICDDDARHIDANEAALEMLQVSREQLLLMRVQDIAGASETATIDATWVKLRRGANDEGELVFQRADGTTGVARYRATADVLPGRHLWTLCNVTAKRRGEASRRLAAIVESADALDGMTVDGTIDYWSPGSERLYGYTAAEAIGRSKSTLIPADLIAEFSQLLARARGGEVVRSMETVRRRKNGSTFAASVTLSPIREGDVVVGICAMTRDISEKKQLEARLAIADRMASVGTLAAGVAHEINNPLAALIANLDLLQLELEECGSARPEDFVARLGCTGALLDDAREAADRIRVTVRDLKLFSGPDAAGRGNVDVHRVLESSLRMASNEIRHRARLVCDFGELPPVAGTDARLGQVILNLVLNAAQAIPDGNAAGNEIRVATSTDEDGWAVIDVCDSGSGIAPEHLAHVFEPFFTTKAVGVGTGLGLSISQRIVHEMGGRIEASSVLGSGTRFCISLPPARTLDALAEPPSQVRAVTSRSGRVLVIDDEPMIAKVVERALGGEHEMHAVTSASAALELIAEGQRFDVILCDVMMPQMTGFELHAALLEIAPEQAARVIFFTGGAFSPAACKFLESTTNICIEKPFGTEQLRALVRAKIG